MSNISSVYVPDNMGGNNIEGILLGSMMNGGGMGGYGAGMGYIWPIIYLAALSRGGLFGNDNDHEGGRYGGRLAAIQEQLQTNQGFNTLMSAVTGGFNEVRNLATQTGCDFNAVQTAIQAVQSAICNVGSKNDMNAMQIVNAVTNGDSNIVNQLASCCCDIKQLVTQQGYQSQLGQKDIQNSMLNGFAQIGYAQRDQTCTIENAIKGLGTQMANSFAALETRALQDKLQASRDENTALKNQLSNEHQTAIFGQQIAQATAPIAAGLNALSKEVDDIKCKLPETVNVPNPPGVLIPNCVAFNAALYGLGGGFPFNLQPQGNVFS